jgi:predicted Rdx family selenoprotein
VPVQASRSDWGVQENIQFAAYAHSQLLSLQTGAPAHAYLFSERGLKPDTWDVFSLGCNPADLYDRPERWGFPAEDKKVFLPRGIVIPGDSLTGLSYVKIRCPLLNDSLSEYLPPN